MRVVKIGSQREHQRAEVALIVQRQFCEARAEPLRPKARPKGQKQGIRGQRWILQADSKTEARGGPQG